METCLRSPQRDGQDYDFQTNYCRITCGHTDFKTNFDDSPGNSCLSRAAESPVVEPNTVLDARTTSSLRPTPTEPAAVIENYDFGKQRMLVSLIASVGCYTVSVTVSFVNDEIQPLGTCNMI